MHMRDSSPKLPSAPRRKTPLTEWFANYRKQNISPLAFDLGDPAQDPDADTDGGVPLGKWGALECPDCGASCEANWNQCPRCKQDLDAEVDTQ